MSKFKYRALNLNGEKIDAEYEARSRNEVMAMLTSNGYYPLKVEEIQQSKDVEINIFNKVTLKDISIFCRQFYTMIEAGVTINRALSILANQTTNKKLKQAIRNIEEDVKKGEILSVSMKRQEDIFPDLLISMVEVGEVTGNLDSIMKKMSDQYEKEHKINNKVKVAMVYPCTLGVISIFVVSIMMTFVMPTFLDIFESMGTELPLITKLLIESSNFIRNNVFPILLFIAVVIILLRIYFKTDHGVYTLSSLKLKVPIVSKLNQKIIVSRFTRTISVLLSSGIPMLRALELIAGIVGNKLAEEVILSMREKVVRGEGLYASIKDNDIFPEMLSTMINIGEETGSLDEILYKTADFYDEELDSQIQITAALLEPLLIVFMGGIIAIIVVAIMLPMANMYNNL